MTDKIICPCCNRELDQTRLEVDQLMYIKFGKMPDMILEKLVTKYPEKSNMESIVDFVAVEYANELHIETVRKAISLLRKKLHSHGWTIRNGFHTTKNGFNGGYVLEKLPNIKPLKLNN